MGASDVRAVNRDMTERLLAAPARPYEEGGYALRVVHTTGRSSGERRSTPLGVVQVGGRLYLVTPDRSRDWARNLEADPDVVLDPGDDPRTARQAPPDEATRAVAAYLRSMQVPWALRAFPVGPDSDLDEIGRHLDTIGVWRLDPVRRRPPSR
jgi:deazaflavin-dependent oxidoreductase (nitroreductase family)